MQRFWMFVAIFFIAAFILLALSCLYIVTSNQCLVVHKEEPTILEKGVYFFLPYTKAKPKKYTKKPFKIGSKSLQITVKIENFITYDSLRKELKDKIKSTPVSEIDLSKYGLSIIQQ